MMSIQSTPNQIVHLIGPIIASLDSANLHVKDGLTDGQQHHFTSARSEAERVKRGLTEALKLTDAYIAQIGSSGSSGSSSSHSSHRIKCQQCSNDAKWREEDTNNYYCSEKCQQSANLIRCRHT